MPGHAPGHLSYYADGSLFSGDVLFAGGVGRVDLPGGDWETLLDSIRKLAELLPAGDRRVLGARPGDDARRRARAQPVPDRASRSAAVKFQAPRGTHDVVPSEQPLWQLATATLAEVAEVYGYRRIQTPVFEDAELFLRTSGQGSDVVQKELYSFDDRSGRTLALRPEGTAPICRAYLEHGMQREPQPVKLYTQATMYRYAAPQKGRYREHWQQSVEAIGSDDPAVDAEVIQLYRDVLAPPRRDGVGAAAELDRRPRVPARLRRAARGVARRATPACSTTTRSRSARRARCACSTSNHRRSAPRWRARRRSASRSATTAASTSRRSGATWTRTASRTCSSRRSCAASTTTRARPSSSSDRRRAPSPRSAPAAATTTWSRRSAARRRRGSASAPESSAS